MADGVTTHSSPLTHGDAHGELREALAQRIARVGVCGLGYVGLPLALAAVRAGFPVRGFDVDAGKVTDLNAGHSYLSTVAAAAVGEAVSGGRFEATADFAALADCDVVVICVPTPLSRQREPDLSYVEGTARAIARTLRRGQLVVLESTSYPGTTREVVKPVLEQTGLVSGRDFFLGFSPEREDPGNRDFETTAVAKVVAGEGAEARELVALFYGSIFARIVPVSSNETAEAVKITENVFRAVNIALVNELKVIFDAMGIDVWEVIEAAKTKPFGYMPFFPGPGLGGHCIPIDPFYLAWKAREYGQPTRFIELAGEINTAMPRYVVERVGEALDRCAGKTIGQSDVLILGLAYKKNVSDTRESPALTLWEMLAARGATVSYHDPHVATVPMTREHGALAGTRSVPFNAATIARYDAVLIVTDHDDVDYSLLRRAQLVIDTRNACARHGVAADHIVKA